jgi:hypothetical protein
MASNNWGVMEDFEVIEKNNGRLTSQWTESLDDAFGIKGTEGRLGEEFLTRVFKSWNYPYKYDPSNKTLQNKGIDIKFKKPSWARWYSCDVKNNLKRGKFYVYADWLFTVKCDRIFHVNPNTGEIVWYDVKDMRNVYDKTKVRMEFEVNNVPAFMTFKKLDLRKVNV